MSKPRRPGGRALGAGLLVAALAVLTQLAVLDPAAEASPRTPSATPTPSPTSGPTDAPTAGPTSGPTAGPTAGPTTGPTTVPTAILTAGPTAVPTSTSSPSDLPTSTDSSGGVLDGVLGGALSEAQTQAQQDHADDPTGPLWLSPQLQPFDDPYTASYPGLPPLQGYAWDGAAVSQLTYVRPSKQYLQVPSLALAGDAGADYGATPPPGFSSKQAFSIIGYIISPPGATHPYGDLPPFRTRLLAFGALPAEATVHLSQVRDAGDLPVGFHVAQDNLVTSDFVTRLENASLTGSLNVRVSDVSLDGTPVDVGDHCVASAPAPLDLVGKGYWSDGSTQWTLDSDHPTPETILTPEQVKDDYYTLATGGLFTGTIDIPTFTGCTGADGDLSRLVSTAVSGPGQPLEVRQSTTGSCFPIAVATQCPVPRPFPYPTTDPG